jgi:Flp pilus assembly protein TadG
MKALRLQPISTLVARARSFSRRLAHATSGAIIVYIAVASVPMVGFLGLAVDTTRGYLVKAQLSTALDAAALAGGRVIFSPTRDADIQMYFDANFPPGYMNATLTGPTWVVSPSSDQITITASAQIETTFLKVLGPGHEYLTVSAETEITRQETMLDVVLAIDMSGSMNSSAPGGGSRIAAARSAATDLVNILFGADATKPLLNIGLVPWSAKVNVTRNGTTFDSSLTTTSAVPTFTNPLTGVAQSDVYLANNSPVPLLSPPPATWQGCVYSRFIDDSTVNDADDRKYTYLAPGPKDWVAWEPVGPEGEPVSGGTCTLAVGGSECRRCLNTGITAMTHTKTEIQDAIDQLTGATGTTNIAQGMGWAWRVLMPGDPFDEADPAPLVPRTQAVILLTDGENYAGSGDGYKTAFGQGSSGRPGMDARLLAVSAAMKAEGVLVYTIQFANSGGALEALMKAVASGPDAPFYHYAPSAAALSQVFHEIANDLSELRLSK